MGQPLLLRSTRQLTVTETGRDLLNSTEHLADVLNNMGHVIESTHTSLKGLVKISASVLLGQRYIVPLLQQLRAVFPDVHLDLSFDDDNIDLLANRVDIAIRIGHLPDSSLIARKLGEKKWGWFASPDYVKANGEPASPQNLREHDCLVFSNAGITMNHWPFQNDQGETQSVEVKPVIQTDNSRALVDMACAGMGIMMIEPLFIQQKLALGQLQPVLTQWQHPDSNPINLLCLGQRSRSAQAVWQFLLEHLNFEREA